MGFQKALSGWEMGRRAPKGLVRRGDGRSIIYVTLRQNTSCCGEARFAFKSLVHVWKRASSETETVYDRHQKHMNPFEIQVWGKDSGGRNLSDERT